MTDIDAVQALLKSSDSPELFFPRGFDFSLEQERAARLADRLHLELQVPVEMECPSSFQDGSLFTRIALIQGSSSSAKTWVYISSFGSLTTVLDRVDKRLVDRIKSVLSETNYNFVPPAVLEAPYSGSNPAFAGKRWLDRYFSAWL